MYKFEGVELTEREFEILHYIKSMELKVLSERLGISPRTVQWH